MSAHTYYLEKVTFGRFDMRQTRFKALRSAFDGNGHPHDLCAASFTATGIRDICDRHGFDCDLSLLETAYTDDEFGIQAAIDGASA